MVAVEIHTAIALLAAFPGAVCILQNGLIVDRFGLDRDIAERVAECDTAALAIGDRAYAVHRESHLGSTFCYAMRL
jgi:hypothetical protein